MGREHRTELLRVVLRTLSRILDLAEDLRYASSSTTIQAYHQYYPYHDAMMEGQERGCSGATAATTPCRTRLDLAEDLRYASRSTP